MYCPMDKIVNILHMCVLFEMICPLNDLDLKALFIQLYAVHLVINHLNWVP